MQPPPVLALHINRSVHYGQYAAKNGIRVIFPEILDLTPFTTSGNLSTVPSIPISSPPPSIPRSTTPTPAIYAALRTIYRLSAVVCHYGQHSFGHYVCYRRHPRPVSAGATRFNPPRMVDPLGPVRDDDEETDAFRNRPGHGWLRISDESVRECGIETVLQEGSGAFMLYYERVLQDRPGIYPMRGSPRSSEETLKPEITVSSSLTSWANGSTSSLMSTSEVGLGVGHVAVKEDKKVVGPRVVRSVATSRGRSASVGPVMVRDGTSAPPPEHHTVIPNGGQNGDAKGKGRALSPDLPAKPKTPSPVRLPEPRQYPPRERTPSPSPSPPPSPARHTRQQLPPRIQTPQPIQPPAMVGLRA
jgi:ubiquitin carboxyl-terminal hydrolase 1